MASVDQAPFSDCFAALKHDGMILSGVDENETIEFPKAFFAVQQQIDPAITLDLVAFGWKQLSDAEKLNIVRSNISQTVLDAYFASRAGQVLITRAAQLHLDFARLGPAQSALLKELTENPMIRLVSNGALGSPEFAEVIASAERHLVLGEDSAANFLRIFAHGTPAEGTIPISFEYYSVCLHFLARCLLSRVQCFALVVLQHLWLQPLESSTCSWMHSLLVVDSSASYPSYLSAAASLPKVVARCLSLGGQAA